MQTVNVTVRYNSIWQKKKHLEKNFLSSSKYASEFDECTQERVWQCMVNKLRWLCIHFIQKHKKQKRKLLPNFENGHGKLENILMKSDLQLLLNLT